MKILYIPHRYHTGSYLQKRFKLLGHDFNIHRRIYKKSFRGNNKIVNTINFVIADLISYFSKPDIILIDTIVFGTIPTLFHHHFRKCPIIPYIKGDGFNSIDILRMKTPIPKPLIRKIYLYLLMESSGIIFISNWMRDRYIKRYPQLSNKKYKIIHHAPPELFYNMNIRNFQNSKIKLLTIFNSKLPDKANSIQLIIDMIKKLPENKYELTIIGNAFTIKQQNNFSRNCNHIKWVNRVSQIELNYYYNKSDIFLHHSMNDACPTVVMEAQKTGLPTIVTNSSGAKELLSLNGISVNPTKKELINAIIDLGNNVEKRQLLSIESENHIKTKLNWDISTRKVNEFITNL